MTLRELLSYLYVLGPCTTRSTIARENAESIAEGAIRGFLTTQVTDGRFGNQWRLTAMGVHMLGIIQPQLKDIK